VAGPENTEVRASVVGCRLKSYYLPSGKKIHMRTKRQENSQFLHKCRRVTLPVKYWVVRFGCFRRINASSPRAVGPAANHVQRPWNILSAFQAALGGAIVKGFTSIFFPRQDIGQQPFFPIFTVVMEWLWRY
jgi:hypothetical protein